jgi:hypothetical protein
MHNASGVKVRSHAGIALWKGRCLGHLILLAMALPAAAAERADQSWYRSPRLSVMAAFICEPRAPYTIQRWMENLGHNFDADQWVKDFKDIGASHLVFYDKWTDGLVFHDTKTTGFKTKRDFLREIAAACQRRRLPLVIYFNAISDGNPEFDQWSLLDREGKPIVFSRFWPTRSQTLHSPYRAKCIEQVRELLTNYGPIDGIWHDIFRQRLETADKWTAFAYQKMFGTPFEKATNLQLQEFQSRTLAGYFDEIDAIRRERKQDRCVFTANESGIAFLFGGSWTELVGPRLQYLYAEGHSFENNEKRARMAWALPKHLDVNLLLNSSWFTPLDDTPPHAAYSDEGAIAATAIAICQGAGVNLALTPGHAGTFGEDLRRAKTVGTWFRKVQPWVTDSQPAADVAIVYGLNTDAMAKSLARAGVFSRCIAPDQPLPACRAIVSPPGGRVDATLAGRLRKYVEDGGTLIACGHPAALTDICGVRVKGNVAFDTELRSASAKSASENREKLHTGHSLDDQPPIVWVSGETPLPRWAEITLADTAEVARIEVMSRRDVGCLIADMDIELLDRNGWRTMKSIRDARQHFIVATLDAPTRASCVRVKIWREQYYGQPLPYADVESIRMFDRADRNLISGRIVPVRLVGAEANFKGATLPPSAVAVKPTTAEVLARFDNADKSPAILCNKIGQGRALLVTANSVGNDAAFWIGLRKMAIGEPTFTVSAETAGRFRFILTQVGKAHVLHVIDAEVPSKNYKPLPVDISLAAQRLGDPRQITRVGSSKAVPFSERSGHISFTVEPDPVATVVFKGGE